MASKLSFVTYRTCSTLKTSFGSKTGTLTRSAPLMMQLRWLLTGGILFFGLSKVRRLRYLKFALLTLRPRTVGLQLTLTIKASSGRTINLFCLLMFPLRFTLAAIEPGAAIRDGYFMLDSVRIKSITAPFHQVLWTLSKPHIKT